MDEQVFIRVYMEITGESESRARAAAMYMELLHHRRLDGGAATLRMELADTGAPGTDTDPGGHRDWEARGIGRLADKADP